MRLSMQTSWCAMQVLQEAQAVDHKYEQGQSITPLCGLVYVMKDL